MISLEEIRVFHTNEKVVEFKLFSRLITKSSLVPSPATNLRVSGPFMYYICSLAPILDSRSADASIPYIYLGQVLREYLQSSGYQVYLRTYL